MQHDEKYAEDDLRQHKIKSALTAALNQVREEVRRNIQGPRPCSRSRPRFGQRDSRLRTLRARSGGSLIRVGPVRYLTSHEPPFSLPERICRPSPGYRHWRTRRRGETRCVDK